MKSGISPEGGEGYSHNIWAISVCAAVKGRMFKPIQGFEGLEYFRLTICIIYLYHQ